MMRILIWLVLGLVVPSMGWSEDLETSLQRAIDQHKRSSDEARFYSVSGLVLTAGGTVLTLYSSSELTRSPQSQQAMTNLAIGSIIAIGGSVSSLLGLLSQLEVNDQQAVINAISRQVDSTLSLSPTSAQREVSQLSTVWHPFFVLSLGDDDATIREKLENRARVEHGDGATIGEVRKTKSWSALSLLLYLNMLGYVENVRMTAPVTPAQSPR